MVVDEGACCIVVPCVSYHWQCEWTIQRSFRGLQDRYFGFPGADGAACDIECLCPAQNLALLSCHKDFA